MLDPSEMYLAAQVGIMRQIAAVQDERPDCHGAKNNDEKEDKEGNCFGIHILGALGEMAVSKLKGIYYRPTINTFKSGGDVGLRCQVRTRSSHQWQLYVRFGDPDDKPFVLVTGMGPTMLVWGWIMGRDAKRAEWIENKGLHGRAHFVPSDHLLPIDDLSVHALLSYAPAPQPTE